MLANTLRKTTSEVVTKSVSSIPNIDRAAPYLRFNTLRLHSHEANFRARPMGRKAWTSKEFNDPFAPFSTQTPCRHVDRSMSGMWYGLGHISLKKNIFGYFNWRFRVRLMFIGAVGWIYGFVTYAQRMYRNGWEWKNKSAVFALD